MDEAKVPPDAVLYVDDVVPDAEIAEVLEEGLRRLRGGRGGACGAAVSASTEDFLLRDQREPLGRSDDAARKKSPLRRGPCRAETRSCCHRRTRVERTEVGLHPHVAMAEQGDEALNLGLRACGEEHS